MSRQEEVFRVTKQIIETEAKLEELKKRFSVLVPDDDAPIAKSPRPKQAAKTSIPARVLEFMSAEPGRVFRAKEITDALPDIDVITLRNTVFRMGLGPKARLVKHGRGEYTVKGAA